MIIRPLTANKELALSNLTINGRPVGLFEPEQSFDSVTIGTQTWMAENLTIDDGNGGIYTQTVNYGQGNVVEYYYTWEAAKRIADTIDGWHLPSSTEWRTLGNYIGSNAGTKLKSTYGWRNNGNGTDDYGFSGFPAGRYNISGVYSEFSSRGRFHTSTEVSGGKFYIYVLYYWASTLTYVSSDTSYCYSVRLVKDT